MGINIPAILYNIAVSTAASAGSAVNYYSLAISAGTGGTVNSAVNGNYLTGKSVNLTLSTVKVQLAVGFIPLLAVASTSTV